MPKRIVVCSDGTWNSKDQRNPTNVVKLHRATETAAPGEQVACYDEGVGTQGSRWQRLTGGALGKGLTQNIQDAYRLVAERYEPGDAVFLFGFSRGAYTARSAAGMIHNCGILRPEHLDKLDAAMELYRSEVKPSDQRSVDFRAAYSHPDRGIKFIGVWDTVGSLGIPGTVANWLGRRHSEFHDVQLNGSVENAVHALAIDERRRSFRPTIWEPSENFRGELTQRWFTGVHSDIGGGYGADALSDIALAWIVERAEACGLVVDRGALALNAAHDGTLHDSRGGVPWKWLPGRSRNVEPRPPDVHPMVDERIADLACDYQPRNLPAARP